MHVWVNVTRYYVDSGAIVELKNIELFPVTVKEMEHRPGEKWLFLYDGPWSMLLTPESIRQSSTEGWMAQSGSPQVEVDGVWGGHNYPEYFVPGDQMTWVLTELGML